MNATRTIAAMFTVGFIGLAACIALIFIAGKPEDSDPVVTKPAAELPAVAPGAVPSPKEAQPLPPQPTGPRRLPVAGREGYFVVIELDGASYLEDPEGKRTLLAEAGPALVAPPQPPTAVPPKLKRPAGQLVVCDVGVVDVPLGAVITYIGRDKVVTHTEDGGSTVFYTDGRVEQKNRPERTDASTRKP